MEAFGDMRASYCNKKMLFLKDKRKISKSIMCALKVPQKLHAPARWVTDPLLTVSMD